jgi:hypothetical protein
VKLNTVDDTVRTNVLGFEDINFSSDIKRYLSSDHASDKLSDKED